MPKGSTVTIYVSSGKDTFELKDYKGYSQSEAESALKSLGLTVRVDYANNDSVDEGDVISTNPAAGSSVSAGDTITIVTAAVRKKWIFRMSSTKQRLRQRKH